MDDATAMLLAIEKDRAEDVPRLAYADVLDERGQPEWAEFIRVQCEIARLDDEREQSGKSGFRTKKARDRHFLLRTRERDLYATSADWLLPHLPAWVDGVVIEQHEFDGGCGFPDEFIGLLRRGFCEAFSGNAEKWCVSADGIVAVHPVDLVRLNTPPRIRSRIGQRDNVKNPKTLTVFCDAYWGDKRVSSEFVVHRHELAADRDRHARMREVRQTVERAADPLVFCHTAWPTVKKWDFQPGIVVGYPFGDDTFMARD